MAITITQTYLLGVFYLQFPTCVVWDRASVAWAHLTKFQIWLKICFVNYGFGDPIATKFCTCHDSTAVMACAKICSNWNLSESRLNFYFYLNCEWKIVSKMVHWWSTLQPAVWACPLGWVADGWLRLALIGGRVCVPSLNWYSTTTQQSLLWSFRVKPFNLCLLAVVYPTTEWHCDNSVPWGQPLPFS